MVKNRASTVSKLLESSGLDAVVFLYLPNIRYLCGFTGTDGALVVARERDCFLTDSRYTTQVESQVVAAEKREYKVKLDALVAWLRENNCRRVGFEAEQVAVATLEKLKEKAGPQIEWVGLGKEACAIRGIKDDEEVAALEKATLLNQEALDEVLPLLRPGITEKEFALELEFALRRRGGEEKAFDFIVASGERGAMPHGVASDKVIQSGELVTIDFGVRSAGYHSDETVTLAVGEPPAELRKIFDIVLEAHDRAMAGVQPGLIFREIDALAREYIAAKGYGDYFGHGLGHGVGLEVHEYPTASPRSEDQVQKGMVFTIEPGIYVPGIGGVRIEDMVLVTGDGCRPLTRISKQYRTLNG
jgi:Xaa-Pro aminopeptidase